MDPLDWYEGIDAAHQRHAYTLAWRLRRSEETAARRIIPTAVEIAYKSVRRRDRRIRESPTGWNIMLSDPQLLQIGILEAAEREGGAPGTDPWLPYTAHLTLCTLPQNSFYVAVGFGRFLTTGSSQEAEAIFRRAAELQSQAAQLGERLPRQVLDESAAAVGIPRECVEQAIQQLTAEASARAVRRAARRRAVSAVAIGVAVCLAIAVFFSHRAFNARLADVEATQAQLDNVLQRRHDLIPNLMAVAKASTAQEQDLIVSRGTLYREIPGDRSLEQKQLLEAQLSDTVMQVMTLLRADPPASATAVFIRLSDELAGAENRMAVERKRLHDAVAAYNRTARGCPAFLLGSVFGFPRQHAYFRASDGAKQAPTF
jgi:LemA protein